MREAVESVLAQTWRDLQVIAVDDNSTDATLEILRSIKDPRLLVVRNEGPQGPSGARNFGASLASSPWLAFQDSDDLWLPEKLERQMHAASETGAEMIYCAMDVKADTRPESPVLKRIPDAGIAHIAGDIMPSLINDSFISTQMILMKASLFRRIGGFDPDMPALVDWEMCLRAAPHGPVAFVNKPLVIQRFTDNSVTRFPHKRLEAQRRVLEKHRALIARYPGALAEHYQRLAGAYRRQGDYRSAAHYGFAALRTGPTPKRLALALYSTLRSLLAGHTAGNAS